MPSYHAPTDDYVFALHQVLRVHERNDLPGFADLTPEFTSEVLRAAAKFHEEVLHPLNLPADTEGARFDNGRVTTPAGFRQAWQAYKEAGWHRMALPTAIGGEGLPPVLGVPLSEMGDAAAHSFRMYGGFCAPVAHMLSHLGAPWMRDHVLPKLVAGDWTATMCLTESHCGTDLRQLRTRAIEQADGSWRLSGTKIFISSGDHDLTDNIIHIVLAKVPDANGRVPSGLGAVNVFLVSKHTIDPASGELGSLNGVNVTSIEHKMGIAGSATCVLNFENAVAWRLADAGQTGTSSNMAAMFLLMNYARTGVAMSGVSYADIAWQNAAAYARERLSGRAARGPRNPEGPADPIIVHPDIRRLLLKSRAFAEGGRTLALRMALQQSVAEASADPAERECARDLLELMTPVMKAYFTDQGFEATNACLQVLGGHGYVHDYGLEQFVRNARIGQLYEGANGIQAIDLVTRKLGAHGGRAGRTFLQTIADFVERHRADPAMDEFTAPLRAGSDHLASALQQLQANSAENPDAPGLAAYDILTMFGILALGWTWAEIAAAVLELQRQDRATRAPEHKLTLARVWMQHEMPLMAAFAARVRLKGSALMELADDQV